MSQLQFATLFALGSAGLLEEGRRGGIIFRRTTAEFTAMRNLGCLIAALIRGG